MCFLKLVYSSANVSRLVNKTCVCPEVISGVTGKVEKRRRGTCLRRLGISTTNIVRRGKE